MTRAQLPDNPKMTITVRSTADIAVSNRAYVIQVLIEHGPQSRAEIARRARVPRGTIGGIVQGLIDDGTLVELAPVTPAGRGKPSRPIWFGERAGLCIGIHLHDHSVEAAAITARGEILARSHESLGDKADAGAIAATIARVSRTVSADFDMADILGAAIAVPGLCDPTGRRVLMCTPIPVLTDYDLGDVVERELGIGVRLNEDSRTLALGERWFGVGRREATFAAIQTGEGIGAGIVLQGKLHPADGWSSEAGHTCIDMRGERCRCGKIGCWETIATRRWLRSRTEALASRPTIDGDGLARLARDAESGDRETHEVMGEYAQNIAIGLSNMALVLGVKLFILHGDAARCGEEFRRLVERETRDRMVFNRDGDVRVVLTTNGTDAGLLGAAGTILQRHFGLVV